jgi:hypothetical protein
VIEYTEKTDDTIVMEQFKKEILKSSSNGFKIKKQTPYKKHQLSHQTIFARFTYIKVRKFDGVGYKQTSLKDLAKLPFPILLAKEIEGFLHF